MYCVAGMARHSGKLTKRIVDAWEGAEGDLVLWDGKLSGFGVKALRNGAKSFVLNYRNQYGAERRYTIGRLSEKLTTEQARAKADELLREIRLDGIDPMGQKKAAKAAKSVNDLLDLYLDSARFAEKAESTQYTDRGRIKRHLRPTLGELKIEQVTPDRVRRAFADIRDGKTSVTEKTKARGKANVRGGEGAARMAIRVMRAIFNWAIKEGLAASNPAEKIEIGSDRTRDSILETPEQYEQLFRALDRLELERRIPDAAADAIRVLAFSGARRNEIAGLRWEHVDVDTGVIRLPPRSHKAGHRTGKHREIVLNASGRDIIAARQDNGSEFVFPSDRGGAHVTLSAKLWGTIRKEAGLPAGISNHSLRHSLGTLMAMQGAQAAEIMSTLGHSQLSTAQRYIHATWDGRAALAEKYTAGIAAAAAKSKTESVETTTEGETE